MGHFGSALAVPPPCRLPLVMALSVGSLYNGMAPLILPWLRNHIASHGSGPPCALGGRRLPGLPGT